MNEEYFTGCLEKALWPSIQKKSSLNFVSSNTLILVPMDTCISGSQALSEDLSTLMLWIQPQVSDYRFP